MIRVAVIGVGRMGSRHAKNLNSRIKDAKLVSFADINQDVVEKYSKELGVTGYLDYKKMLDSEVIDAVVIAVPHYAHVEIAKYCVEKNKHVLLEKPISVTTKSANELLEVVNSHKNVICSMMYNQRTNRMYQKAKELISNGCIGDIQRVSFTITDWYRSQFYYNMGGWRASWNGEGGGTLINQCVHQLDVLQWLIGMPNSIRAYCQTKGRQITTENDVTAFFRYNDFDCVFTASTHEIPGVNRLEIAGSKGLITISKFKMSYVINSLDEKIVNTNAKRDYGNKADKKKKKYKYSYGLTRLIKDGIRGQQANILDNFIKAIELKDRSVLIAPINEGIKALELINCMNLSSWMKEEINLPINGDLYEQELDKKKKTENR